MMDLFAYKGFLETGVKQRNRVLHFAYVERFLTSELRTVQLQTKYIR